MLQGVADCPHDPRPAWFDPERDGVLRQLYSNSEYKQEILGETPSMVQAAFPDAALRKLQETSAALFETVDAFFVFIDPSGGGESATGVCSCLYTLTGTCMVRKRNNTYRFYLGVYSIYLEGAPSKQQCSKSISMIIPAGIVVAIMVFAFIGVTEGTRGLATNLSVE